MANGGGRPLAQRGLAIDVVSRTEGDDTPRWPQGAWSRLRSEAFLLRVESKAEVVWEVERVLEEGAGEEGRSVGLDRFADSLSNGLDDALHQGGAAGRSSPRVKAEGSLSTVAGRSSGGSPSEPFVLPLTLDSVNPRINPRINPPRSDSTFSEAISLSPSRHDSWRP